MILQPLPVAMRWSPEESDYDWFFAPPPAVAHEGRHAYSRDFVRQLHRRFINGVAYWYAVNYHEPARDN